MVQRFDTDLIVDYARNGFTILVPNQRVRDAILQSYAQRSTENSLLTPDVNAIDIWIRRQWQRLSNEGRQPFAGRRILETLEEVLVWQDLIEKATAENPLLNTDEAAASAQQAYQLFRLWLDDGVQEFALPPHSAVPELERFRQWAKQFSDLGSREAVISLADATRILTQKLENAELNSPQKIVLINFYQPPPLYARLFGQLIGTDKKKQLASAKPESSATRQKAAFPDPAQEVAACARWAHEITLQDSSHHIGIIHNGDTATQRLLHRAFLNEFNPGAFVDPRKYSDPPGIPGGTATLLESRILNDAWLILNLGTERQDSVEFSRLLRSEFILAAEEELEQRVHLEAFLREVLERSCTVSQLIRIMSRDDQPTHCPALANALLKIVGLLRENRPPLTLDRWSAIFRQQLQIMGWPGPASLQDKTLHRLVDQWENTLNTLSGQARLMGSVQRGKALTCLRTLLQNTRQRQSSDLQGQVSFYALPDAVGINFTHTWFLGFSDQSQPPPPSPNPFLLHAAQRQAGIPGSHSHGQLEDARQSLDIVCRSTAIEIRGSFHRQDGDEQYRECSLLAGFKAIDTPAQDPHPLNRLARESSSRYQIQPLASDPPVAFRPAAQLSGGQAILSDQSSCPFRAFARHRLQATSLATFRNGLDARARGTATHVALEHLFKQIRSRQQLVQLSKEQVSELTSDSVSHAIGFLERRFPEQMTPRFRTIEAQRLQAILTGFMELEKQRSEFDVVATENPVTLSQGQLTINLKIDRIDRLADGSVAVIDYKTGKTITSVSRLTEARPENLQLPVYYCAASADLDETVSCVAIAQVNRDRIGFSGLAASDNFHGSIKSVSSRTGFGQDWLTLTDEWQALIQQQSADFTAGLAAVDPVNGSQTCQYCDLHAVCRIQELQPLSEPDEQGEQQS